MSDRFNICFEHLGDSDPGVLIRVILESNLEGNPVRVIRYYDSVEKMDSDIALGCYKLVSRRDYHIRDTTA